MLTFILRRLGISVLILLLATFVVYSLIQFSGDPLAGMRELASDPKVRVAMEARIRNLQLDTPWGLRYLDWLKGTAGCLIGQCDLGLDVNGNEVSARLAAAADSTLRLVTLSVILAIVIGIGIGVLTAVRQYSDLDYIVTFLAFVFFSLPVFWAAVLLKEYAAINYNNWIADPGFSTTQVILTALVAGFVIQLFMGGSWKRRLFSFLATAVIVGVAMVVFTAQDFWRYPSLPPWVIALIVIGVAVFSTSTAVGIKNKEGHRHVLLPALICAVLVMVVFYAGYNIFLEPTVLILAIGLVLAIAVPWLLGFVLGGRLRVQAISASLATVGVGVALTMIWHIFNAWPEFLDAKPRPISTIGSQTPNFEGGFWLQTLDRGSQILLPTILLTLVSVASYSRYTRATMMEINSQDYIRTARAKGLPERTVILRHAFRNALIPIVTIVVMDFAALIGGAIITEQVFGWKGMGELFQTGLNNVDPNPVMAFVVVTGGIAVLFNLLADVIYALIDPRIRV